MGGQNCILGQKVDPQGPFGQIKSADLRFGVLEPSVGETVGGVYLPPTPLRPGAGHRRATNSSEGVVEETNPLGRVGYREKNDCGAPLKVFLIIIWTILKNVPEPLGGCR